MASGLPQGLLTNSQSISGNIERVDRVAIEDISRLWQGMLSSLPADADVKQQANVRLRHLQFIRLTKLSLPTTLALDWRIFSGGYGVMKAYINE